MKNKGSKRKVKYAIALFLVIAVSILLMCAIVSSGFDAKELLGSKVRSEVVYALMLFMLALPVVLLVLAIVLQKDVIKGRAQDTIELVGAGVASVSAPTPIAEEKPSKAEKKAEKKAEAKKEESPDTVPVIENDDDKKGRFCKLCHIDEIKATLQRPSYDEHITLRQFCENFRNYAANKLKL